MKHVSLYVAAILIFGLPNLVHAKVNISVARFADYSEVPDKCPQTKKAKEHLAEKLQAKLIAGLAGLERFRIQEREGKKLKTKHDMSGAVHLFEVCNQGRSQDAKIELELKVTDAKTGATYTFTSNASATATGAGVAPEHAMTAAIGEIIKRVDNAFPNRKAVRLVSREGKNTVAKNDAFLQKLRRSPNDDSSGVSTLPAIEPLAPSKPRGK